MRNNAKAIARLSSYRESLERFNSYGSQWVLSEELAQALSVTAAQVRKDFSCFKVPGKKKLGYRIDILAKRIDTILDKHTRHPTVLVGADDLGSAVANQRLLDSYGARITAVFDGSPENARHRISDQAIPVLPYSSIIDFVKEQGITLAVLCVTGPHAQQALDMLVIAGIKGVLNIGDADIKTPRSCVVNSLNLGREFEKVVYFTNLRIRGNRH